MGEDSIVEGEVIFRDGHCYTKSHTYFHPKLKKTIKLIGTNHAAPEEHYRLVEKELSDYDIVLYEGAGFVDREGNKTDYWNNEDIAEFSGGSMTFLESVNKNPSIRERYEKIKGSGLVDDLTKTLECTSLQMADYIVEGPFSNEVDRFLGFKLFYDVIDVKRAGWEFADTDEHGYLERAYAKNWESLNAKVPEESLATDILNFLEGLQEFRSKGFSIDTHRKIYTHHFNEIIGGMIEEHTRERNSIVMKKISEKTADDSIRTVGIVYGAAHIPYFRGFVEGLGFEKKEEKVLKFF